MSAFVCSHCGKLADDEYHHTFEGVCYTAPSPKPGNPCPEECTYYRLQKLWEENAQLQERLRKLETLGWYTRMMKKVYTGDGHVLFEMKNGPAGGFDELRWELGPKGCKP